MNPTDVAAWLDADEARIAAVAAQIRVIRQWCGTHGWIGLRHPLTGQTLAGATHDEIAGSWWWWVGACEDLREVPTKTEAMDAIRAAMRARGMEVP